MRIAILGGTFNPVHNGHLDIAAEVKSRLGYDRIVFVPANIPAHKTLDRDVGASHRLKMLQLAVKGHPWFVVDDCELRRGGTSYTIDTVREIRESYPLEGKPGLIIGDDLAEDLGSWKDVDKLVELVDLIVAHRRTRKELHIDYPCRFVDNALSPVSSSQIREALRSDGASAGRDSARDRLPPAVYEYIQHHDLYR
jgi:nicotinate-nucleotide adenylyltransferase